MLGPFNTRTENKTNIRAFACLCEPEIWRKSKTVLYGYR